MLCVQSMCQRNFDACQCIRVLNYKIPDVVVNPVSYIAQHATGCCMLPVLRLQLKLCRFYVPNMYLLRTTWLTSYSRTNPSKLQSEEQTISS